MLAAAGIDVEHGEVRNVMVTQQVDVGELKRRMQGAIQTLKHELAGLRTGRASAALVEPVQVQACDALHLRFLLSIVPDPHDGSPAGAEAPSSLARAG